YRAGRAKMLAVATTQRAADVPEVPTMAEAGLAGFRSDTWNALAAPPRTSPAIAAKLNSAINAVLDDRATAEELRGMSMTPVGGTREEMRAFVREETERWGEVIRAAGLRVE